MKKCIVILCCLAVCPAIGYSGYCSLNDESGGRVFSDAVKKIIERQANSEFIWTDGILGSKIQRIGWLNASRLTLVYTGDRIKFQNDSGVWENMIYTIYYDPVDAKLLKVTVREGRL